jgi:stearoyl-CoA desaturase (delta-9 desaturase)
MQYSTVSRGADPATQIYWENILVLILTHLLGLAGIAYAIFVHFSWWTVGIASLWMVFCVLSTTGGYHRLFAHRTYRAAKGIRLFYLLFGAGSGQGSALRWSADHRVHHAHTDEDQDPHNIRRGFWWAHWGWLFYRGPPLVRFQHRYYLPLAALFGFVLPGLIALAWSDFIGVVLLAGFLRLALQYQATFCINSVAHSIGRRPYARDTSARDSFIAAILTLGEGYHNFHHRFPGDYRNGAKAGQFDPTKWWIWTLSKLGFAWGLKRTPKDLVQAARRLTQTQSEASGMRS